MSWGSWDVPDLGKLAQSASLMATEAANAASSSMKDAAAAAERSGALQNFFNLDNLQTESSVGIHGAIVPPPPSSSSADAPVPKPLKAEGNANSPSKSPSKKKVAVVSESVRDEGLEQRLEELSCMCTSLQAQLAESNETLIAEKKISAEAKAAAERLKAEKQSAVEKGEDDLLKANRKCADLQEELSDACSKVKTLESDLAVMQGELAAKAELLREATAAAAAVLPGTSAGPPTPEPPTSTKGKGKGGKGAKSPAAGTSAVTVAAASAEDSPAMKKLTSDLAEAESKLVEKVQQLDDIRSQLRRAEDLNTAAERKAKKTQEQLGDELAAARSESGILSSRIAQLTSELAEKASELLKARELHKSLTEEKSASDKKNKAALQSAQTEVAEVKKSEASKEAAVQDLQGKVSGLTEKMKELMKKYAEAKTKAQSLEEAEGSSSAQMQKTVQTKDSELLSLRLKLENSERVVADQRATATELTERYGETQRELTRSKNTVAEHVLQIEELQRELQGAVSATSGLAAEAMSAQEKAEAEQKMVAQLKQEKASLATEWAAKLDRATLSFEAKLADLQREQDSLQVRLKSEDETAKALEEYKKRAQVALKKANATSSTMTVEIAEKQKALDDALARTGELEAMAGTVRTELREVQGRVGELEQCNAELMQQIAVLNSTVEAEKEKAAQACAEQGMAEAKIKELEEEAERASKLGVAHSPAGKVHVVMAEQTDAGDSSKGQFLDPSQTQTLGTLGTEQSWAVAASAANAKSKSRSPHTPSPAVAPQRARASPDTNSPATTEEGQGLEREEHEDGVQIDEGVTLQVRPPSTEQLFYVNKLHSQIEGLKKEVAMRGIDVEAAQQELQSEREAKVSCLLACWLAGWLHNKSCRCRGVKIFICRFAGNH